MTTNGGQYWAKVYSDSLVTNFINKITFFDDMNGIALGDQAPLGTHMALLNTTDGGNTWNNFNQYLVGSSNVNGVEFLPPLMFICLVIMVSLLKVSGRVVTAAQCGSFTL